MPLEAHSEFTGVVIELIGDILTVTGLTGQRLATLRAESDGLQGLRPCLNSAWIMAFLIYAIGQLLELFALGFASESTVVATGNLTLVFNAFASVWVFGEQFAWLPRTPTWRTWRVFKDWDGFNLMLLVLGSVLTVLYSPLVSADEEQSFDAKELEKMWFDVPFVYFSFISASALVAFTMQACSRKWYYYQPPVLLLWNNDTNGNTQTPPPPPPPPQPFRLACVLAVLASFSVTMSKVVTELFSRQKEGEKNQFLRTGSVFMVILWLISLVVQIVIINVGLRDYEQSMFIPLAETMSTSFTILAGILYFKTYNDFHSQLHIVGFSFGVVLLVVGLFLSSRRHSPSKEEIHSRLQQQSPRHLFGSGLGRSASQTSLFGETSSTAHAAAASEVPLLGGGNV